jgi:16S rRNA (guanine966-N2)-methyltransferase
MESRHQGAVRVIAGRLGGRELRAPRGRATRPTSDRVREALFSMLGELGDARVLDLYAGSGALGIEALSRGALHATFVESGRAALGALRENLERLGLGARATVLSTSVARAAAALASRGPFDLVLADPPWTELEAALSELTTAVTPELLAPGFRLIVEHPTRSPIDLPGRTDLQLARRRAWGDTSVTVFAGAIQPAGTTEK